MEPTLRQPATSLVNDAVEPLFSYLCDQVGLQSAALARITDGDCKLLRVRDQVFGIEEGMVLGFEESICGAFESLPESIIIPDTQKFVGIQNRVAVEHFGLRAIINVPIRLSDSRLFGSVCAFAKQTLPAAPPEQSGLLAAGLKTMRGLLEAAINAELALAESQRQLERLEAKTELDNDSGLYNRSGWERLVRREENRCTRYSSPASVIAIELDDAPPVSAGETTRSARDIGNCLRRSVRESDLLARISEREFLILLVETDIAQADAVTRRIRGELDKISVTATIGAARRDPRGDLHAAVEAADLEILKDRHQHASKI